MAYPHKVARVTLSGDMFDGAEQWTTGFYMGFENSDAPAPTDQGAADIAMAWATFFSHADTKISSAWKFKMCKVQTLGVDGKVLADTARYYSPPTTVVGGGTSNSFPPQVSLVATLANSLPRGLATKGRMYLPGVNVALQPNGKIDSMSAGKIADQLQAFFNTIFQDADTPGNPVLVSLGNSLQLRPGAIRNVTQIRVGDVYDTQRRRRNALTETYVTRPVSVG